MKLNSNKIVILHNVISPYKTLLFNELYKLCNSIKVLYMAETESNREWNVKKDELKFPYEIMFQGCLNDVNPSRLVTKTWKRLNELDPDILTIGGYSYTACWAAFFWAKVNKKRIILWSASNEEDRGRFFLKEKLKGFLVKRCDAANVYGKRNKDYLVKLGMDEKRIFIKGNTTDNSFYHDETLKLKGKKATLCKELGIPSHNFLYIGRFSQEKNILKLLDVYRRLDANPEWGLILVGSGPQKGEIENYIRTHSVKNIFMPGFKQKEEIPQYLAVSDLLVLPSTSEPWGLVVNEAMAAGLPVLVSKNCGCYPDIVHEEVNGFSFDPFNVEELHELMKNVIEGKYDLKNMGEASLQIIQDYTPEKAARVVSETIEFVLNGYR